MSEDKVTVEFDTDELAKLAAICSREAKAFRKAADIHPKGTMMQETAQKWVDFFEGMLKKLTDAQEKEG